MTRGTAAAPAMEMTKWFDTDYHYIVPELHAGQRFHLASTKALEHYREAKALGIDTRPVLVGPVAVSWHPDHLFIEKLYIGPEHQGRGIGAFVLRAKTSIAAESGLPTKLSVLTPNPADQFYRREGLTLETETAERRRFSKPVA